MKFMLERYEEAVNELLKELTHVELIDSFIDLIKARVEVYRAITYICREIVEADRIGTEELISRIKKIHNYQNNSTLSIAVEFLESALEWFSTPWILSFQRNTLSKNAIKKLILSRMKTEIQKPEPKPDLIFGIKKEEFCKILVETSVELELPKDCNIHGAIVLVVSLIKQGMCIKQIITELSMGFGATRNPQTRNPQIDLIAFNIMEKILERYEKFSLSSYSPELAPLLKHYCVKPVIEDLIERLYRRAKLKPEDTFKAGDRVFFIKHSVHPVNNEPYRINLFLGIVKDWAVGSQGRVHCTFHNSFNIMDLGTLDLDILCLKDVDDLIKSEYFSKSLIKSNSKTIYGDITLYPVEESMFPKLNKIVANL